ncbi:MAG TPA: outer membrane beta-barrel protein [Bradyrhizobium sp.]|nr:outer membrane beta-barrel protein [Bradyrhizobium sp.]
MAGVYQLRNVAWKYVRESRISRRIASAMGLKSTLWFVDFRGAHMHKSFRWTLASIISLGGLSAASAADMAVKAPPIVVDPSYNWTGFYLGLDAGYASGVRTGNIVATSGGLAIPPAVAAGTIPTSLGIRAQGGFGGVQMGYNWQSNRLVLGVEGDLQAAGIQQSQVLTHAAIPGFFATMHTASSDLNVFGTARGRIGYTWNQILLYGTGGVAFGNTSDSATSQTVPPPPFGSGGISDNTRVGWAAGAGIEWAFAPSWSLKGEYLRIDLGSSTIRVAFPTGDFIDYRFRHAYDVAKVGINLKLGAPPVVAKY